MNYENTSIKRFLNKNLILGITIKEGFVLLPQFH